MLCARKENALKLYSRICYRVFLLSLSQFQLPSDIADGEVISLSRLSGTTLKIGELAEIDLITLLCYMQVNFFLFKLTN